MVEPSGFDFQHLPKGGKVVESLTVKICHVPPVHPLVILGCADYGLVTKTQGTEQKELG